MRTSGRRLNSCFLTVLQGCSSTPDNGLGKTSITLAAVKVLKKEKLLKHALIVAPLRVIYSVWPKEVVKWKDFNELSVSILHGPEKPQALKQAADCYLINPEGLQWFLKNDGENLKKLKIDTLIIDESSKFKHTQTLRYKTLKPFLKSFRRRWILTGSPTPNGLLDLFGQMYILDLGAALSPYITQYRRMYFNPTGFGGYEWQIKPGAAERINQAIKPMILRLDAEDYLELPELIYNDIYVDLDPKVMKVYRQMEDQLYTQLANGEVVTAANAGVATMKCRQIANGGLYKQLIVDIPIIKGDRWEHLHMTKAEAVADLVEELEGQPCLIAYDFEQDLERLFAVLGKDTPYIGGGVSAKRGQAIELNWNAGKIPVLMGHPASMAHGLNLQDSGNAVVWHSLTWNFEHYDQFIRRVWRQGSKHKRVFVHHIIARGTIDEVILRTLRGKDKTQKGFLNALKENAKEKGYVPTQR